MQDVQEMAKVMTDAKLKLKELMVAVPKPVKKVKDKSKHPLFRSKHKLSSSIEKIKSKTHKKVTPNKQKAIKKALDNVWRDTIHKIYGGVCSACGKSGVQAHHFFGRKAYPSVKWDVDNGVALCVGCHIMKVHRNGQTEIARDALIKRIGQIKFEELKKRANETRHYKMPDLIALKEQLVINLSCIG